jgi:hypothetical protein
MPVNGDEWFKRFAVGLLAGRAVVVVVVAAFVMLATSAPIWLVIVVGLAVAAIVQVLAFVIGRRKS